MVVIACVHECQNVCVCVCMDAEMWVCMVSETDKNKSVRFKTIYFSSHFLLNFVNYDKGLKIFDAKV